MKELDDYLVLQFNRLSHNIEMQVGISCLWLSRICLVINFFCGLMIADQSIFEEIKYVVLTMFGAIFILSLIMVEFIEGYFHKHPGYRNPLTELFAYSRIIMLFQVVAMTLGCFIPNDSLCPYILCYCVTGLIAGYFAFCEPLPPGSKDEVPEAA